MPDYHIPVLLTEACDSLKISAGKNYIDATLGHGGHTIEILKRGGIVHAIDQDPYNLELVTQRIKTENPPLLSNFHPLHHNFSQIDYLIDSGTIPHDISGLLADLGLNSQQQKDTGRGFSFNDPNSLDMRLDQSLESETAESIINTYPYDKLVEIFTKNAQEKLAEPIVRQIIIARQQKPIKTATRLADIICQVYKQKNIRSAINPATKIFMALRISVNQEIQNLKKLLDTTLKFPHGCQVAFISFHSGEDRLVKLFTKTHSSQLEITKAITPTTEEIRRNPLSRSAVLRSYKII